MELQQQAILVRNAINHVITTLMDDCNKLDNGGQTLATIMEGLNTMHNKLYPYSDMATERITDYIVYHLYRKRDCKYRLSASNLFSVYAITKYWEQFIGPHAKTGMNYYIDQWLKEGGLTRADITKIMLVRSSVAPKYIYLAGEEVIKKRFLNMEDGYLLCGQATTGYAPRSETCSICKYAQTCADRTKRVYPEISRLRTKDFKDNGK